MEHFNAIFTGHDPTGWLGHNMPYHIKVRRRLWRGYTVVPDHEYEPLERQIYHYRTLEDLLKDWQLFV